MHHIPVMVNEIKNIINQYKPKKVLDLTFGGGGHSGMLLEMGCEVIAFDRDPIARQFEYKNHKFKLHTECFSRFHLYEQEYDITLADLGISTMQLEERRGFSFMKDGPLDMRMDTKSIPLGEVINNLQTYEIERILKQYGEVNNYKKIAKNIEIFRINSTIDTTFQLRKAIKIDDFKFLSKVFQAFRIFLNEELLEIEELTKNLKPRIGSIFITFHSLEDRIIKKFCKQFPNNSLINLTSQEKTINPKSRSAKLRFGFY